MPRLRAAMVCAQLVMAGCSAGPPSAPSAAPPPVAIAPGLDVSGVWSGDARVVSCTGSRYRTAAVGVSGPAGRWQGSVVARGCTPPAWSQSSCYPYAAGEAAPFTLDLTADAALAGVLRIGSGSAPVSGTWDGATLRLSGEDGGSSGLTVLDWQAAPDRFARLQGTLRVRWAGGLSPAETLFELSGVVR